MQIFKIKFKQRIDIGTEYFEGCLHTMAREISQIIIDSVTNNLQEITKEQLLSVPDLNIIKTEQNSNFNINRIEQISTSKNIILHPINKKRYSCSNCKMEHGKLSNIKRHVALCEYSELNTAKIVETMFINCHSCFSQVQTRTTIDFMEQHLKICKIINTSIINNNNILENNTNDNFLKDNGL